MAYTTPSNATVGQILTSARWNAEVRDNLRYLKGLDGLVTIESDMVIKAPSLNIGAGLTGNRSVILNFQGDDFYTDGLRISRDSGGQNAPSRFVHRGLGALQFQAYDGGQVEMIVGSSSRVYANNTGVGIANTNPRGPLHVNGIAGGFLYYDHNNLQGGTITVLPAGSVTTRLRVDTIAYCTGNGSAFLSGTVFLKPGDGTAGLWAVGTGNEAFQVVGTCASSGSFSIARNTGSNAFRLAMLMWYC